jgi:glutamate synthase (NADPH/NADH) large chain
MTGGVAVILGKTGRNLAAGMSGGYAFIYKLRADHVNHGALSDGEIDLLPLTDLDTASLKTLIEKHEVETGSKLASKLLQNFESVVKDFTKVLPRDYARVLEIQREATQAGESLDSPKIWSRILEVSARG